MCLPNGASGMPIRFRCSHCNRLLGIARRKAGAETSCPHCGSLIRVPAAEGENEADLNLDELDEILKPVPAVVASSAAPVATRPSPPPMPRPVQAARPESLPLDERPLFEGDLDAVLGGNHGDIGAAEADAKPKATSGMDALSLGAEPVGQVVLTPQKATVIVVIVVVLLALAFVAGFLIASQ